MAGRMESEKKKTRPWPSMNQGLIAFFYEQEVRSNNSARSIGRL